METPSFSITDSAAPFSIDQTTGDLVGTGSLDRETRDRYELKILATDSGYPLLTCSSEFTITVVDRNDNSPIFSEIAYIGALSENSPGNTFVVKVTANDADLGEIRLVSYRLTPESIPFRIDSSTGDIFAINPLDFEVKPNHTFTIVASDNGNPACTSSVPITITLIDVNEGAPMFDVIPDDPIIVNTNLVKGNVVYTVQATKQTAGRSYSICSSTWNQVATLN